MYLGVSQWPEEPGLFGDRVRVATKLLHLSTSGEGDRGPGFGGECCKALGMDPAGPVLTPDDVPW